MKANLILNGHIEPEWLKSRLEGKTDIYCTDGAYNSVKELGIGIEAVIGDMDSIDSAISPKPKLITMEDQEYTDFEKAIAYLKEDYSAIDVYCASGKAPDHFLGNLSVGKKYKDKVELMFFDPGMRYFFAKKKEELENVKGKTISIMPFPIATGITYSGLQYPLEDADLTLGLKTGVRNKAVEDTAIITYKSGCLLVFIEDK
jgi:thiamine pyrophosphokinase